MWIQRIHFGGVPRLVANISREGRNFYHIFIYAYVLGNPVRGTTIDIEEVRSLTGKKAGSNAAFTLWPDAGVPHRARC